MLFSCFKCNNYSFSEICPYCGQLESTYYIPLDPKYLPEFKYQSQGVISDFFMKKKKVSELTDKLEAVLKKYYELKNPYFINYLHIDKKRYIDKLPNDLNYSKLEMFKVLLARLGFKEILEFPNLTEKLLRSTEFNFEYISFVNNITKHKKSTLKKTLYSWIEESGALFRKELPLFIYYLWQFELFKGDIKFNIIENRGSKKFIPVINEDKITELENLCEKIFFEISLKRFKNTLEKFDPNRYVTIYKIDTMDGFEFEEFLAHLFMILGYEVEETKRTQDQGADLFVTKFGKRIVIQAKRYLDNIGNAAVQQALSAKSFFGCDSAYVITNRYFTPSAIELAEQTDVRLIDRNNLKEYLYEYNQIIIESHGSDQVKNDG